MYQINCFASQLFDSAQVHVSISETDDSGDSEVLATAATIENGEERYVTGDELADFLDRAVVGFYRLLSISLTGLDAAKKAENG